MDWLRSRPGTPDDYELRPGNKQIVRSLAISERTVRNRVSNIYKKLHVYDRTQAVLYAIREGLVDVDGVGNG